MNHSRRLHQPDVLDRDDTQRGDRGFSTIEILVVMIIFGILASLVVMAVTGLKTEAAETGCAADQRQLWTAAEAYFAQNEVTEIPATGTDHDRFERTLVEYGLLRGPSEFYDLDAHGVTTTQGNASC